MQKAKITCGPKINMSDKPKISSQTKDRVSLTDLQRLMHNFYTVGIDLLSIARNPEQRSTLASIVTVVKKLNAWSGETHKQAAEWPNAADEPEFAFDLVNSVVTELRKLGITDTDIQRLSHDVHLCGRIKDAMNSLFDHIQRCVMSILASKECGLTPREIQVLTLVREGLTNKEIAVRLCVETQTVKNHMHNILHKMGVKNRLKAAIVAERLGFLPGNSPPVEEKKSQPLRI